MNKIIFSVLIFLTANLFAQKENSAALVKSGTEKFQSGNYEGAIIDLQKP